MKYAVLVLFILCSLTIDCRVNSADAENMIGKSVPEMTPRPFATNSAGKKTGANTEKAMVEDSKAVVMKASASISGDRLVVNYELKNESDRTVYVWDQMIAYAGSDQVIDENAAYVFYEEPNTIRLVRANLALPPEIDVARKEIPFSRILAAKAKITGAISLEMPLKEYSPFYGRPEGENALLHKCTSVRLMIGWLEAKDGMKISERKVGDKTVLAIRGAWPGAYHHLAEQKLPIDVDLVMFKSIFDRSLPLH